MAEAEDDLVGQILLGKLEVIRKIGGGGMGVVYEVEHRLTGHRRALKVVHAKYADRPRFMKRLLREAKVAGTLSTPYVVETYDAGRLEDGSAYVLMELLHGKSFYETMQAEGRLAPRRLADIMSQVAEGMAMAHAAGIVHRDLKPENIFLVEGEDRDRVKILDFGVSKFESYNEAPARLTAEGTLVGTPYYMSPEQAAGRTVDARTDVYAMGVIMYESLAGRLPYEADSVGALFVKIGAGECIPLSSRRPDLDNAWCALIHKAFHRDPEQRFASAEALRRELLPLLTGGATAARAKTISDGVRANIAYPEHLPPPPRKPAEADALIGNEPEDEDEARALSPPPLRTERRALPAIVWALGGAVIVLLVVVPLWLASQDTSSPRQASPAVGEEAPVERARELAPAIEPPVQRIAAPPVVTAVDAGVRRPRRVVIRDRQQGGSDPASKARLDPNPYRQHP